MMLRYFTTNFVQLEDVELSALTKTFTLKYFLKGLRWRQKVLS